MDQRILDSQRLLESSMSENLRVVDVAARVGLSLHHFHRLFLAETGEPPASFLRRIRMDAAALRLKWTDEPAVSMADALGYHSRAAFVRAFQAQFGLPPGAYRKAYRSRTHLESFVVTGRNIMLRELDSFHLVTRRYVGNIDNLRDHWQHFMSLLPGHLAQPGNRVHVGLLYDDPRVTAPDRVRYDCGVTVSRAEADPDGLLARSGLQLVNTHPGRYGSIAHRGTPASVAETYDTIFHRWLIPNGFIPGHEPALEVHDAPRHLQDRRELSFTVLIPLE